MIIRGKPSAALADKLESDEKARIAAQVEKLGPEGVRRAQEELDEAKAEHDKPIPTEILKSFAVPSVKSIAWISVQSVQEKGKGRDGLIIDTSAEELSKHIQKDGSQLPFFVQYDHVEVRKSTTPHIHLTLSEKKTV